MADGLARLRMTPDEFLHWCLAPEREDERWEFVDGEPVQMMAGATDRHDAIVVNLIAELRTRLRGGPCAPRTADSAVKTQGRSRVRRPEVLVDCGPRNPLGLFSATPTAVIEVLSKSTANLTLSAKLSEYQGVETVRCVLLIDQDKPYVRAYARAANDAWTMTEHDDPAAVIEITGTGASLSLADIYRDVAFDPPAED